MTTIMDSSSSTRGWLAEANMLKLMKLEGVSGCVPSSQEPMLCVCGVVCVYACRDVCVCVGLWLPAPVPMLCVPAISSTHAISSAHAWQVSGEEPPAQQRGPHGHPQTSALHCGKPVLQ